MEKEHNKIKGIRTWTIIIPSIIILAILHISIVLCVFNVSAKSREMSETMQKCAERIDDVTSLQAGSSILSDTITSFAYKPYIEETHEVNYSQSFYDASISIGYAIYDEDEKVDIDKLFNIADREMYMMKAIMHNKVS